MTKEMIVEYLNKNSGTNVRKCMECGKCDGRCPAYNEMDIRPHQFISFLAQGKVEELMRSKSIYTCLSCMACVERCPRGVAPANVIEAVRNLVLGSQGVDGIKAEEVARKAEEGVPQQLLVSAFRKYKK